MLGGLPLKIFTVDTIWNIGETGDMYSFVHPLPSTFFIHMNALFLFGILTTCLHSCKKAHFQFVNNLAGGKVEYLLYKTKIFAKIIWEKDLIIHTRQFRTKKLELFRGKKVNTLNLNRVNLTGFGDRQIPYFKNI